LIELRVVIYRLEIEILLAVQTQQSIVAHIDEMHEAPRVQVLEGESATGLIVLAYCFAGVLELLEMI